MLTFKYLFFNTEKLVVLGKTFQERLVAINAEQPKIVSLSTMFDGESFKFTKRTRTDDEFHFIYLGRFIAEKGLVELLEAFRSLAETMNSINLFLAGDGPFRKKLEDWIAQNKMSSRVQVFSYLRDQEKAQFLLNGDCFVLPTYYSEGCPISLLEAMAAGLPVITTPVGGIPDIVEENINGMLLDDISPSTIARAMGKMVKNEEWCNSVREANKRKAWNNFECKIVTSQIEKLYCELISSNRSNGKSTKI